MSTDTSKPSLIQQTTSSWIAAKLKMTRPSNKSFLTPYSTTTGNISITPVGKAVERAASTPKDPLGSAVILTQSTKELTHLEKRPI